MCVEISTGLSAMSCICYATPCTHTKHSEGLSFVVSSIANLEETFHACTSLKAEPLTVMTSLENKGLRCAFLLLIILAKVTHNNIIAKTIIYRSSMSEFAQ